MRRSPSIFALVLALVACAQLAFAQIPTTLSLQALLNDNAGDPVADGSYDVTFRLYSGPANPLPLWSELQSVTTENGIFDVMLGSVTPFTADFEDGYYVSLQLDGEPEMTPRIELTAAAYAFMAATVEDDAITHQKIADATVARLVNTLQDSITIEGGANVTVTTDVDENKIIIAASGGGGTCTTLDGAYDCDTPGAGRTVIVDSGSVKLDGTTANQNKILEVIGGANAGITAEVTQNSVTPTFIATTLNANNPFDAVIGVQQGTASGVYGRAAAALPTTPAPRSGVRGESKLENGVSGRSDDGTGTWGKSNTNNGVFGESDDKNGVEGNTKKSGTWALNVPANLVGGVLGRSAPGVDSADNFGVIGNARDYGGIGVFGLGGIEKGHGVMGMSGTALPDRSNAGVRGVTYEGVFPPVHWDLDDTSEKLEVGVLGQALNRVAVWGESGNKFGGVGTTGGKRRFDELPGQGLHPGEPAGLFGMTDTESRNGVHGWATTPDEDDAGVVAEGDGINAPGDPRAAALEIRNGAIRVSGMFRPADSVSLPGPMFPIMSCDCVGCEDIHRHQIGVSEDLPIDNPLAKPDSIVLVSIEGQLPLGYQATVQVLRRDPGSFRIRYAILGDANQNCVPPSTPLTLHYQIINPFPMGAQ